MNRSVDFIHNVHEQGLSTFEKVRSFSTSYMGSYLSKALIASITLSYLGFSFSTAFPVSLALIVFTSFISFALDSIKEAIYALAQKGKACLTRIAQVISDIFAAICTSINSFAWQATDFKVLSSAFEKKLPINYAVVTDNEVFNEKTISDLVHPCLQKSVDLANKIQKDTQTIILATSQKEFSEIDEKSDLPYDFSGFKFIKDSSHLFFLPFENKNNQPFSIVTMPRIAPPNLQKKNPEVQKLIMISTPPPTLKSPHLNPVKLGIKTLNFAKKFIK